MKTTQKCPGCGCLLKNKEKEIHMGVCCFCGTVVIILSVDPFKLREAELNDLIHLPPATHKLIESAQRKARNHEMDTGNPN